MRNSLVPSCLILHDAEGRRECECALARGIAKWRADRVLIGYWLAGSRRDVQPMHCFNVKAVGSQRAGENWAEDGFTM